MRDQWRVVYGDDTNVTTLAPASSANEAFDDDENLLLARTVAAVAASTLSPISWASDVCVLKQRAL